MKTWTYEKDGVAVIVSAENVEQAIYQLEKINIQGARNVDLIPCPVTSRYTRVLNKQVVLSKSELEFIKEWIYEYPDFDSFKPKKMSKAEWETLKGKLLS